MVPSDLFTIPNQVRYFEDYVEGAVCTFGSVLVNQDEVIEFASRFDPQVFHVDAVKAKDSHYGGLIASGWHTASMMMSQLALYYLSDASSLGSPGLDNLRWLAPVRPGDTLHVRVTTTGTRRSTSKPGRGIVKSYIEVLNQDDTVVMDINAANFIACRP